MVISLSPERSLDVSLEYQACGAIKDSGFFLCSTFFSTGFPSLSSPPGSRQMLELQLSFPRCDAKEERKSCPSTQLSHFCFRTHIPVQLNGLQLAARKTGKWKSFIPNSKIPAENCVSGAKAKRRMGVSLVCPTASIWGEEEMKLSVASQGRSQG